MSERAAHPCVTLGETVERAEQLFLGAKLHFGHGMASAFDEAVYLALHTLGLPLHELDPVWDRTLSHKEVAAIQRIVNRRAREHIPAAYLTHEAWLGPYRFHVDERVIVPRSFIAELLHEEMSPWIGDPGAVRSVLDLCTGSGCLAILAALTFPNSQVDAVDLSADALDVARWNITDYRLTDRVSLFQSDMFSTLAGRHYDLIISNPPYVTGQSMAALPAEYRCEPEMALASGTDGLDHVRTILREAPGHLNDAGLLVVEAGFNRDGVEAAFRDLPFTWAEVSAGDDIVFMLTKEEFAEA